LKIYHGSKKYSNSKHDKNAKQFTAKAPRTQRKDSDFMDQGNRVAVIYADAVGSLQKNFARFASSRFKDFDAGLFGLGVV
jgi:hypothetical protein